MKPWREVNLVDAIYMNVKALKQRSVAILIALILPACGGGGSSADPPVGGGAGPVVTDPFKPPELPGTAPAQYTIKGIISVAETAEVDSDTNDPRAPYKSNDNPANAQAINNPSLLVGHLTFRTKALPAPTAPRVISPTSTKSDLLQAKWSSLNFRQALQKSILIFLFEGQTERRRPDHWPVNRRESVRMHSDFSRRRLFCKRGNIPANQPW